MEFVNVVLSCLSGGLAGGCVNVMFNRLTRRRDLRTRFYPQISNMYSEYLIRMSQPGGRYWHLTVGQNPAEADRSFVEHRSEFIGDLVQFNELKEVLLVRKALMTNMANADHTPMAPITIDLKAECEALDRCLKTLHRKLRLD